MQNINQVKVIHSGHFQCSVDGMNTSAGFTLFLIHSAWISGIEFEDIADGFGEGLGTMGGDWSGIRDSTHAAKERMLERAITHMRFS